MPLIRSICKALLTFIVLALIVAPTLDGPLAMDVVKMPVLFPVVVFSSVMILHWLIWQFIVPDYRLIGRDAKSLLIYPVSRDFFSGIIAFGYCSIALYCLRLAGYVTLASSSAELRGHLAFSLILIGIGIAARLRNLMFSMQSQIFSSREENLDPKCDTISEDIPVPL